MAEKEIDLVFAEMVMKVVDFDFEVELVEHVEENIVVEEQDKLVDIEDIEDFSIRIFPTLSSRWILRLWGPRLPWHGFNPIVLWLCI